MSDPRMTGLALMGLAITAFLGTTTQRLPSVTFFPALAVFVLGAIRFLRANSAEMAKAEKRVERKLNPTIRTNRQAQAHAERLAARRGSALSSLNASDPDAEAAVRLASGRMPTATPGGDAIEITDDPADLVVTTDVSFPIEVQTGDALADQLKKLNQLMTQGVLTEEEYAVAKAKLLG